MQTLLIAVGAGIAFIIAYHTYGRWLGSKIFNLSASAVCPSHRLRDDMDYVPTAKPVVFGHHFTSIAGTGPIVGPAIAVMWGWLPALLWVVFGSIFIGAVHDLGALVVSLRNNGQTVGDIAGRVLNKRVRLLFLFVLFLALTVVLAIFGLVIAAVFRQYPASIFPCMVQIPIAVGIGFWLHRKGVGLAIPSILALALMYLTVIFGDQNTPVAQLPWLPAWLASMIAGIESGLHAANTWMASWPTIVWVAVLLVYSYVASVLPVWMLLQPRDYINSLQLISALGLIVIGLMVAAFIGGAPPAPEAARPPLAIGAPMWNFSPADAPLIFPFLFITIACGAVSGFHCLVSSGTSSKQLDKEPDARFVGYGSMLTEGFLATLVILACVAGLGLGIAGTGNEVLLGEEAFAARYTSWTAAGGLARTVGAFVDGSANFLKAMGLPAGVSVALMGVLVASFAGTTLDTACRLQRYVVQELASTFAPRVSRSALAAEAYDFDDNREGADRRTGEASDHRPHALNPLVWLTNMHGATIFAIIVAGALATMPPSTTAVSLADAWAGNLSEQAMTDARQKDNLSPELVGQLSVGGASGIQAWIWGYTGKGGSILWPLFGATNQLLAGLSFMVVGFYLWRRNIAFRFPAFPAVFMLLMPLLALGAQVFFGDGSSNAWVADGRWVLVIIGVVTLALEVWMIIEALLLFPKVKGVLEAALPDGQGRGVSAPLPEPVAAGADNA